MSDRERLIDLIEKQRTICHNTACGSCGYASFGGFPNCQNKMLAHQLIENGVIVPPCKVGDKVYKISRNKVKECEVVFIGISADEKCSYFNFVENYADGTFYKSYSMVFEVIGKTVFLTKEEAEEKVKELSKDENK